MILRILLNNGRAYKNIFVDFVNVDLYRGKTVIQSGEESLLISNADILELYTVEHENTGLYYKHPITLRNFIKEMNINEQTR